MAERDLDDTDVGAVLEQMGSKRMAQGAHMGRLGQTGGTGGFHADLMDGFARNGPRGWFAGEKPLLVAQILQLIAEEVARGPFSQTTTRIHDADARLSIPAGKEIPDT